MNDEIKGLVERLKARAGKRAPVQGLRGGIPWAMHLRAYDAYCKRYGRQDALIDLEGRGCRGGFATEELDAFIPGWRAELESPMPPDLATQAAAALTLSDEARVRAEELSRQRHHQAVKMVTTLTHSVEAYAALVRELVEGLRPLVEAARSLSFGEDWNNGVQAKTHGYREKLLAALPKAHALILKAEGEGSSVAMSAAPVASQPGCSAAQSLDGGEG